MTITGKGRGDDGVLSSFRHLAVGLAFDVDVSKGIGTGDAFVATQQPRLRLSVLRKMLQWWLCCVWKGSCCLHSDFCLPVTSLLVLFFHLLLVLEVPRSPLEKAIF